MPANSRWDLIRRLRVKSSLPTIHSKHVASPLQRMLLLQRVDTDCN